MIVKMVLVLWHRVVFVSRPVRHPQADDIRISGYSEHYPSSSSGRSTADRTRPQQPCRRRPTQLSKRDDRNENKATGCPSVSLTRPPEHPRKVSASAISTHISTLI